LKISKTKAEESAGQLRKLLPKSSFLSWNELQHQGEYLHAKDLLKTLGLIR